MLVHELTVSVQGDLFGYILDLTGGITASLTGFILPSLTYLAATKGLTPYKEEVVIYRRACFMLAVFGATVMVLVPTAVVLTAIGKAQQSGET